MKAFLFPACGAYRLIDMPEDPDFRWYTKAIDSDWMEIVHPRGLPDGYCMIADEEGLLNEKPFNIIGSYLYGYAEHGAPIVGDLLIVKEVYGDEGPELAGMTVEEAMALLDRILEDAKNDA